MSINYRHKYEKYKQKYIRLKITQIGGSKTITLSTGISSLVGFLSILDSGKLISTEMRSTKVNEKPLTDDENKDTMIESARQTLCTLIDNISIYPGGDEQRGDLNWFFVMEPTNSNIEFDRNDVVKSIKGTWADYIFVFQYDLEELNNKFVSVMPTTSHYFVGDNIDDVIKKHPTVGPGLLGTLKKRNAYFVFYGDGVCPNSTFPIPDSVAVTLYVVPLDKHLVGIYYKEGSIPEIPTQLFDKYLKQGVVISAIPKKIIEPEVPEPKKPEPVAIIDPLQGVQDYLSQIE
ncbi:MAG: hypothetical protein Harvfovirus71_7 [Harvfovirus sp.]|uniref:Uncharacterized protein n=1 Tax=Harvfovirus sp. TaxID=2487768 RepID=A0A3G5A424_9VIRU|nr:MAG: hypothetical protein Harvfovirus71_7 [Harvfovirus sp.]